MSRTTGEGAPARRRGRRLLALAFSAGLLLGVLLLGELWCRWFTDVPWLGNSRTLFVSEAFGESAGNHPSSIERSFGVEVHLDALGFRIDPEYPDRLTEPALLLLGDSVGFGPGVVERDTFAGRMRRALDDVRLYNSSVVGYSTHDYANVAEHFLPGHPEVRQAYLVFCLNDVSAESARTIRASLQAQESEADAAPAETATAGGLVERLRPWLGGVNEVLRSRSKLYLFLKNELTDPRRRYFFADHANYVEAAESRFEAGAAPLLRVRDAMARHGVDWTVVVLPYATQLRTDPPSYLEPQERIAAFLETHGIRHLDATAALAVHGGQAFLAGDPMHLSTLGHGVLAEFLLEDQAVVRSQSKIRRLSR